MRLLVVFVTASDVVTSLVAEKRTALLPPNLRADNFAALGGEEVSISAYRVSKQSTVDKILEHIQALEPATASSVVLLTDGSLPGLVDVLGDVFCTNQFQAPAFGRSVSNILSGILAKCLRSFRYYKTRFTDQKYHRILRLPLRNFSAQEIGQLRQLCHDMMNARNFGRELDALLALLRQRQRPKKASSYSDLYLVDNDEKHFALGMEVHARAETACPPHNALCLLGNNFRFGHHFDGTRHFNVSRDRDARMNGMYPDCHAVPRPGGGAQHLNMFSNDFF